MKVARIGDWEVNLLIEYRLNMEKAKPPYSIHNQIIRQMKKYDKKQIEEKNNINQLKKLIKSKK